MTAPYLSVAELDSAPTGINFSNIPTRGASVGNETAAKVSLIAESTSWIDSQMQMGFQPVTGWTLSATTQVEVFALTKAGGRRARLLPDGTFRVFMRYLPVARDIPARGQVVQVSLVEWSPDGVNYSSMAGWTAIAEGAQTLRIVPPGSWTWGLSGYWGDPSYGWLRVTCVAGFPNTTIAVAAHAGDSSVQVADVTGTLAGDVLNIYDGPSPMQDELVTVASSWAPATGPGTIPLTTTLAYAHAVGLAVSGMPTVIRLQCRRKLVSIVQVRGGDAVTQGSAGRGRPVGANLRYAAAGPDADILEALQPFKRAV